MIFDLSPKENYGLDHINIGIARKNIKYKWIQYKPRYSAAMITFVTILTGVCGASILYFIMFTIRLYHLRNVKNKIIANLNRLSCDSFKQNVKHMKKLENKSNWKLSFNMNRDT